MGGGDTVFHPSLKTWNNVTYCFLIDECILKGKDKDWGHVEFIIVVTLGTEGGEQVWCEDMGYVNSNVLFLLINI